MKSPSTLVLAGLLALPALAQSPALAVPVGSVGVAYLEASSESELGVRVVFAASTVPGLSDWSTGKGTAATAAIAIGGDLVLFDARGPLGRVPGGTAAARFWCENDGGVQFRAELAVKLPPAALKRKLVGLERLQQLAAFVAVVPHDPKAKFKAGGVAWRTTSDERVLDGDLDGDKKPDAVIFVAPDAAHNCDGKPKNNLQISLLAGDRYDPLRCCGP